MKPVETPYEHREKTAEALLGEAKMGDRLLRMQHDFWEPALRFRDAGVKRTVVFFGSASLLPPDLARRQMAAVEAGRDRKIWDRQEEDFRLRRARNMLRMAEFYDQAEGLALRLAQLSQSIPAEEDRFFICSGGGNGIMEAANRGAYRAGCRSIALSINIPTEQTSNGYASPDLSFNFNYFLLRKFWLLFLARALIVFPGGAGTLDELFEVLNLIITGRQRRFVPVILYGSDYWRSAVNFDFMVENGTLDRKIFDSFLFCDGVDQAYESLRPYLMEEQLRG